MHEYTMHFPTSCLVCFGARELRRSQNGLILLASLLMVIVFYFTIERHTDIIDKFKIVKEGETSFLFNILNHSYLILKSSNTILKTPNSIL